MVFGPGQVCVCGGVGNVANMLHGGHVYIITAKYFILQPYLKPVPYFNLSCGMHNLTQLMDQNTPSYC